MKEEIEKMKSQYDLKIEDCDKLINSFRRDIAIDRRSGNDKGADSLRKERAIFQARRQAYVQAKYDFDSLLDYV